ncbi:ATP-binding protein [Desulfovulcanus sp.]
MLERTLKTKLGSALEMSPVVMLVGARQVGKTTLVLGLERDYIVMDDITELDAALHDPQGYIAKVKKPVTIDEIQKIPGLLPAIKLYVDKKRVPGDFLLTGSANVLSLKRCSETLAGRVVELTLWPLSAKEKNQKPFDNPVETIFTKGVEALDVDDSVGASLLTHIVEGGYPLSFLQQSAQGRFMWFNSYISTYIERDVRTIGELRDIDNFIRFYNILMPRSASLLNKSELSKESQLNKSTVDNYISLLEKVYQIYILRPYFDNIKKRFVKSPKFYVTDSGLLCHILNIHNTSDLINSRYKGNIFETFIFSELLKHISYSNMLIQFFFYRTHDKREIDFILQSGDKKVAIEVKAAQSVTKNDFSHIIDFQNSTQCDVIGIVFYSGNRIVPFGRNLFAVPISVLL